MKKIKLLIVSILCFVFSGCSNNTLDYYGDKTRKLDLRTFFDGDVEGSGSLFDFRGDKQEALR